MHLLEGLLFGWLHVVSGMLADGALVVSRKLIAFKWLEIAANLADEAFLLFDFDTWDIFKYVLAMLAERADIVIWHFTLVEVAADGASIAFFLFLDRSFLWLDMSMIVGVCCTWCIA